MSEREKIVDVIALDMCCGGECVHGPSDCRKIEYIEYARGTLAALDAAGYVIAPKEPTEAMLGNGYQFITRRLCEMGDKAELINLYRAMIVAATRSPPHDP